MRKLVGEVEVAGWGRVLLRTSSYSSTIYCNIYVCVCVRSGFLLGE